MSEESSTLKDPETSDTDKPTKSIFDNLKEFAGYFLNNTRILDKDPKDLDGNIEGQEALPTKNQETDEGFSTLIKFNNGTEKAVNNDGEMTTNPVALRFTREELNRLLGPDSAHLSKAAMPPEHLNALTEEFCNQAKYPQLIEGCPGYTGYMGIIKEGVEGPGANQTIPVLEDDPGMNVKIEHEAPVQ